MEHNPWLNNSGVCVGAYFSDFLGFGDFPFDWTGTHYPHSAQFIGSDWIELV